MGLVKRPVVCHLTTVHKASDNRIFLKECCSLAQEGYTVHLVASGSIEEPCNVIQHPLDEIKNRFQRIFSKQAQAYRTICNIKPYILHIHDPELILLGLCFKKKLKCKLVFDVHEYYRSQIKIKSWIKSSLVRNLASYLYSWFEKIFLNFYDGLILAVPGMVEEYSFHNNVIVIRNTPIIKMIEESIKYDSDEKRKILIYPGTLSAHRGVYKLIESLEYIDVPCVLWLVGTWHSQKAFEEATKLPQWNKVKYWGKLTAREVYSLMKCADVGLQLIQPEGQYEKEGIPVKVLEYFAAGVPVILSDITTKRSLFKDAVYYVDPTEPKKIAAGISEILNDLEARDQYIRKGNEFIKKFSWEMDKKKLISFYLDLERC